MANVVIGFCIETGVFVTGRHTKFKEIKIKSSCQKLTVMSVTDCLGH